MSRQVALYQWNDVVAKCLPQLSKALAACWVLWSLGLIMARSCALTTTAWGWVPILTEKFFTLREPYREAPVKAGNQRSTLDRAEP